MFYDDDSKEFLRWKEKEIAVRIIVEGKVQGVGYRAWLTGRAKEYKLNGWVRNRSDASVEAVLAGPEKLVEEIVQACYHGSPMASVKRVKRFPYPDKEQLTEGFSQLPTS